MLNSLSVGLSRPPNRLSRVVLPDPDGPIKARKSPRRISRFRLDNTFTDSWPFLYALPTCCRLPSTFDDVGADITPDLHEFLTRYCLRRAMNSVNDFVAI